MRLIDADKLRQSVTNEMIKAELNSPLYCTLECVISDIDGQPTAYDVDKVVERLEKMRDTITRSISLNSQDSDVDAEISGEIEHYRRIIGVVKSGGMD